MHKKLLIGIVLTLLTVFSFTICYAENQDQKDMVQNAENGVQGAMQNAGNMVNGAANSIKDGAQNLGNAVVNGASNAGKAVEKGANDAKNAIQNTIDPNHNDNNNNNDQNNDGNYTATRTAGENTFMGMNSNTWSWLILGVAAVAIIALVWYYSVQLNNDKHNNDRDE